MSVNYDGCSKEAEDLVVACRDEIAIGLPDHPYAMLSLLFKSKSQYRAEHHQRRMMEYTSSNRSSLGQMR